ncbi:MAG: bifunctional diaminohydroxyphosphoribosylaminopyrimidine deaminase/5-amino-6-(5-phosphoribosylamino)uracil reductase RibD [Deltaproteobacteria bacterium]|nr:MAG: bifunctional diaminohydroxyphosphoribosylaminopyrimidine deaminase/5-amino-6-(5-phosphoribosylamino)uracil reductase RibD [Deltaproteobacteria bacterium]
MKVCLNLARRGEGRTSPNPMVGAVIIRAGRIVGKGYHPKAGQPHAEIEALKDAGKAALGAEMWVNLEPCNHWGRTGPCTDAIIKSGIKRVFVGMEDPNPRIKGKGIAKLRKNGLLVKLGVMETECRRLNESYSKFIRTKTPWVILKAAASLDGKTATRTGQSRWISGELSRRYVHRLRGKVDGILVGVNTIIKDDPLLTARLPGKRVRDPVRIVVDSKLSIPLTSQVLNLKSEAVTIVATTGRASPKKQKKLKQMGAKILTVRSDKGMVNLPALMKKLGALNITSLLIEGGSTINASALSSGIVDKIICFYAPRIIGGRQSPGMVGGSGAETLDQAIILEDLRVKRLGEDVLIEGYVKR